MWRGSLIGARTCLRDHYETVPWFRATMFIFCSSMFLAQISNTFKYYLEYNSAISIEEKFREGIVFPGATVCVDIWMNSARTCAFTNGRCSRIELSPYPGSYLIQEKPEIRRFGAYRPEEMFNCTITHPECPSFQCISSMRITFFRIPAQLCYTVDVVQYQNDIVSECASPWLYELELHYKVNRSNTIFFTPTNVLPLIVHAPYTAPPDKLSPITLQPGTAYDVVMKQKRIMRLKAPYKSRCVDYVEEGYKREYGGYLNYDLCLQNCSIHLEFELCKCIGLRHEYGGSQESPVCNFSMTGMCERKLHSYGIYKRCEKQCGLPCEEISYDLSMVGFAHLNDTVKGIRDKFTLRLSFASEAEEVTKFVPALTRTEVLAYTGAYLGTWTGISILHTILNIERWYRINKRYIKRTFRSYVSSLVTPAADDDSGISREADESE